MRQTGAMPDVLSLRDLDRASLDAILDRSDRWADGAAEPRGGRPRVATIFSGPAFRTRLAFDTAIDLIGGHRVDLPLTLGEREPIADTAAVLGGGVDAVVIRHGSHADVLELAEHCPVPVVNAMTASGHPCEVVSEAFTVRRRRGSLDGLRLTFVGEATNLFRSWCELSTAYDIAVTQVAPPGFEAPQAYLDEIAALGGSLATTADLAAGADGAHAIYTDGWPEEARVDGPTRVAFERTTITADLLDALGGDPAAGEGVLMHCMPVRRGDEVTAEAFAHPRSITLEAKRSLAPTHAALLEFALGML